MVHETGEFFHQEPEDRLFDHQGKKIPLDAPGLTDFSRYTEEELDLIKNTITTGYHVDISAQSILEQPLEPPQDSS